jgi:TrmH family RNA methyltransferase
MLTKNTLSIYQKLYQKKFRQKYGLFLVEGTKTIQDFIHEGWELDAILYIDVNLYHNLNNASGIQAYEIDGKVMKSLSALKNPSKILAIVKQKNIQTDCEYPIIALDNIQDPGNLGTIIRTADWYGVKTILCSKNTVDCFNPKVVQATMGSLARMNISYVDLVEALTDKKVYATVLNGKNIRNVEKHNSEFVILLGNEGNGIDEELLKQINSHKITIPSNGGAESLNVSIAAAICMERLLV